jgi:hypothetical protein
VSALVQWWREIERGERTPNGPLDALWGQACKEMGDIDFYNEVTVPQRMYLAELQAKYRPQTDIESITEGMQALELWRRWVLESDKRHPPLEVAAAWELTAVECERLGHIDVAEEARAMARAQLKRSVA